MLTPEVPLEAVSRRMRNTGRRDTSSELKLRRELHKRGLRYRVDYPVGKRRRADILFTRARVAVFVDGCFWHSCPNHGTMPKHNREWWQAKLMANVARDRRSDQELATAGYFVIRIWEHETPANAANVIEAAVRAETYFRPSTD